MSFKLAARRLVNFGAAKAVVVTRANAQAADRVSFFKVESLVEGYSKFALLSRFLAPFYLGAFKNVNYRSAQAMRDKGQNEMNGLR